MRKFLLLLFFALMTNFSFGQNRTAIDSLKNALRNSDIDTLRALVLRELSVKYLTVNPDSSLIFGLKAKELSTQLKFPKGQARSYMALAFVYRQLGDFPNCWRATNESLQIAIAHQLYLEQALSYNMLAIIYDTMGDDAKQIEYYKKALQINSFSQAGFLKFEMDATLFNNIGNYFLQIKNADSAVFYFHQALSVMPSSVALSNLGKAEAMQGNLEAGFSHMREALQRSITRGELNYTGGVHRRLAETFMMLNQIDSAVLHSKTGLAISQSIKNQLGIYFHAKNLAAIYDTIDVKQAYFYQKIADKANEEVRGTEQVGKMQRAMLEEMERQTSMIAKKQEEETQLKQLVSIGAVIVLLIVVFILLRSNRKVKKAKLLVEAKNNEIQSTQRQLIQSEKMASLGELTAGIAHEIQNPLNFVNNFSEVNTELIKEIQDERRKTQDKRDERLEEELLNDIAENEKKINHHGKRADAIVKGMLQHSRSSSGQKELTDINALCDEYLRLSYHGLRAKDKSFSAKFETNFDSSIPKLNIVPQDIGRVVLNLINNAFYAVSERHKAEGSIYEPNVIVSTHYCLSSGEDRAEIEIKVKDNGKGIPQSIIDKIFQPFFTTKPTGQGTGLGLSLSYDIVKAHGGELRVESTEGQGSVFSIQLPSV